MSDLNGLPVDAIEISEAEADAMIAEFDSPNSFRLCITIDGPGIAAGTSILNVVLTPDELHALQPLLKDLAATIRGIVENGQ